MSGVETLAVALGVFADEPDSMAKLLFLRGDPCGRPGDPRLVLLRRR